MRFLPVLLVCGLAAWSAQAASIDRIDVVAYGIVSGPAGVRDGVSSNGIEHRTTNGNRVVVNTARIPACIGMRFGVVFAVVGTPGGVPVTIREFYKFPPSGLHKPGASFPIHETYFEHALMPGRRYGAWYEFDSPWELALGDWTFELHDGNRVLASQTFTVVAPRRAECPALSA